MQTVSLPSDHCLHQLPKAKRHSAHIVPLALTLIACTKWLSSACGEFNLTCYFAVAYSPLCDFQGRSVRQLLKLILIVCAKSFRENEQWVAYSSECALVCGMCAMHCRRVPSWRQSAPSTAPSSTLNLSRAIFSRSLHNRWGWHPQSSRSLPYACMLSVTASCAPEGSLS